MNNKYPQITFVFDRRKVASPTTKSSVDMRICYNYKQKYISTGIKLYSTQWRNGKIINCPDMLQISQTLDKMLSDVRQIIYEMIKKGSIDISIISKELEKKNRVPITFIEFCNVRAGIRKYGRKKDSQERYDRFLRLFSEWGKIKYFEDLIDKNIISYDKYLTDKGMKAYSRWNNYHRFINGFILDAIKEGLISRNPYEWININKEKSRTGIDKYLTFEEFKKLKNAHMPTPCLERVRDLFVFQTYTCLRYSDLAAFDSSRVQEMKGVPVYLGDSIKTAKRFTIPLLTPAIEILHKYEGKLPIISNVKYNLYLKSVAQAAGIDKKISSHWARHTGATMLLNEGTDMKIVSKVCGHSSTRITEQVYAKLLNETVVDGKHLDGLSFHRPGNQ